MRSTEDQKSSTELHCCCSLFSTYLLSVSADGKQSCNSVIRGCSRKCSVPLRSLPPRSAC